MTCPQSLLQSKMWSEPRKSVTFQQVETRDKEKESVRLHKKRKELCVGEGRDSKIFVKNKKRHKLTHKRKSAEKWQRWWWYTQASCLCFFLFIPFGCAPGWRWADWSCALRSAFAFLSQKARESEPAKSEGKSRRQTEHKLKNRKFTRCYYEFLKRSNLLVRLIRNRKYIYIHKRSMSKETDIRWKISIREIKYTRVLSERQELQVEVFNWGVNWGVDQNTHMRREEKERKKLCKVKKRKNLAA